MKIPIDYNDPQNAPLDRDDDTVYDHEDDMVDFFEHMAERAIEKDNEKY